MILHTGRIVLAQQLPLTVPVFLLKHLKTFNRAEEYLLSHMCWNLKNRICRTKHIAAIQYRVNYRIMVGFKSASGYIKMNNLRGRRTKDRAGNDLLVLIYTEGKLCKSEPLYSSNVEWCQTFNRIGTEGDAHKKLHYWMLIAESDLFVKCD